MQENGVPTLAPMATLELACAAGCYMHADGQPLVAGAAFGASLPILEVSRLEITCDLKTGAFSVQNVLRCTLSHLIEVSSPQSFPLSPFTNAQNISEVSD